VCVCVCVCVYSQGSNVLMCVLMCLRTYLTLIFTTHACNLNGAGLGASFNLDLVQQIAMAISDEAR